MKKILIPIDFSENAHKALLAAKIIASRTGAELTIMHTSENDDTSIAIPATESTIEMFGAMENSYKHQLEEYVAGAQSEGYKVTGVWESTGIHTAILRQATEINADLIVVGRTGHGTFIDKLIGSSSTGVALDAYCPVLVVPPQATVTAFGNIVYATQFDPEEKEIIDEVKALANRLGAKLSILKINPLRQTDQEVNETDMLRILRDLDIAGTEVVVKQDINVIEGINRHCYQENVDLLIVSTRERGFFEQYLTNPSVTKRLVLETNMPLLVYHIR